MYASCGPALSREESILKALGDYRRALSLTRWHMERAGVTGACSSCAAGPEGSCCYPGVENWYDEVLLLINFLLGVDLSDGIEIPESCFFVGPRGCRLLARHAFCVNYLCPALQGSLDPEQKRRLQAASGEELFCGWELEGELRRWMRKAGDSTVPNAKAKMTK